jgi:predicted alpha/beta hydrolase
MVNTDISVADISLPARDGFALAATSYVPATAPRAAVLFGSATAAPRRFYRGFASYLAEHGFIAVTFDYRGIGGSRPPSLRGFRARMRDWALLDFAGAIDHVRQAWPILRLALVGHSFGGQALGLAPNADEVSRALLVASQAGTLRLVQSPERYRVWVLLNVIGRPVANLFGYLPSWAGLGEDLPRDVFLEWVSWVMKDRYFFDDLTLPELQNFSRFKGRLRAIGLDDDPWATPAAINLLISGFSAARVEHIQIKPKEIGVEKIGHFGFFRSEHRDTLWRDAMRWLGSET